MDLGVETPSKLVLASDHHIVEGVVLQPHHVVAVVVVVVSRLGNHHACQQGSIFCHILTTCTLKNMYTSTHVHVHHITEGDQFAEITNSWLIVMIFLGRPPLLSLPVNCLLTREIQFVENILVRITSSAWNKTLPSRRLPRLSDP